MDVLYPKRKQSSQHEINTYFISPQALIATFSLWYWSRGVSVFHPFFFNTNPIILGSANNKSDKKPDSNYKK